MEYPVSPISRVLIPLMLGILSLLVLTVFANIQHALDAQLKSRSITSVSITEFVAQDRASTILSQRLDEELLWQSRFGQENVHAILLGFTNASVGRQTVPILAYSPNFTDIPARASEEEIPKIYLFRDQFEFAKGEPVNVEIGSRNFVAQQQAVPAWLREQFALPQSLALPMDLAHEILAQGFQSQMYAELGSMEKVEDFVKSASSYYHAENRSVKIVSALEILKNLKKIEKIQSLASAMIVVGCGLILALTLGSIAWLEYRQEVYLLALLRSFGTPKILLLFHMMLENLVLVLGGMALAFVAWGYFYQKIITGMSQLGMPEIRGSMIEFHDARIVFLAGVFGVTLSMLPVAFGLRKQVGLILQ